jgi:hypothetical protein
VAQPAFDEALPALLHDHNQDLFFWESQRNDDFPDWLIAPTHYLFNSGDTHLLRIVAGDVSKTLPSFRG